MEILLLLVGEDSISLERGGSLSPLDTSFDKDVTFRYPSAEAAARRHVSEIGQAMHYPSYLERGPDYEAEMRYYRGDVLSPNKDQDVNKSRNDSVFGDFSTLGRDSVAQDRTMDNLELEYDDELKYMSDDSALKKSADSQDMFGEDLYARQSMRYGRGAAPVYRDSSVFSSGSAATPSVLYQGDRSGTSSVDTSEGFKFPPDDSVKQAVHPIEDYMESQQVQRSFTAYSAAPPGRHLTTGEGQRYSSYSGSSFSTNFDPDNVPVDRTPVYSGFLISFMVDARGGAMRGSRHTGVRIIIPPRKCCQPTRVTCRLIKKEKLTYPPVMCEGEGLAARIIEMGPVGTKFLGPIILEVPHFASLRGKEREIVVMRSDDGEKWYEHPLVATEEKVAEALGGSLEGLQPGTGSQSTSLSSLWKLDQEEDLAAKRIARILTTDFPMYFALVSRIRQENCLVGEEGGVISSTVVPQVQAVFPEGTLAKKIKVGLQAHPIAPELVAKLLGNRVAVSPVVTVEPRRRKFRKPMTLTIPLPKPVQKGMINQYGGDRPSLRLLYSMSGGKDPAVWEDITKDKPMTLVNDCVSFTTTVSARFWLMDCQNVSEAPQMATALYREAVTVPYMAKFVVFAKRNATEEGRLRMFCMTDDKVDKTLEKQEKFHEVARSRDLEVLEGRPQHIEMAGNLIPVTKSGDQLNIHFKAFRENRLPCTVRIRDLDQDPSARVAFMRDPKVSRGEAPQTPICNLNITLPDLVKTDSMELSSAEALELRKRHSLLREHGIVVEDTISKAQMRLSDVADTLQGDWVILGQQLDVSMSEINRIKTEHPTVNDQALAMLHLWVEKNQQHATGVELEKALRKIHREDVVRKCIYNVEVVQDEVEAAAARATMDQSGFDDFKEEVGISKDSLKRGMSLDVQFDEQDILKESESAAEEESSPGSERGSVVEQRAPPPGGEPDDDEGTRTPPPSPSEQTFAEERVVRDETGLAEAAAARLPTEQEGTSVDDQEHAKGLVDEPNRPEAPEQMISPMSDGSYHDGPSAVPEPTLPPDFIPEELELGGDFVDRTEHYLEPPERPTTFQSPQFMAGETIPLKRSSAQAGYPQYEETGSREVTPVQEASPVPHVMDASVTPLTVAREVTPVKPEPQPSQPEAKSAEEEKQPDFDSEEVFDSALPGQRTVQEKDLPDGSHVKHVKFRSLSVTGEMEDVEVTETEGPIHVETKCEDEQEVLPDGTVHTLHKVRRHSAKHILRRERSMTGEEIQTEEEQVVPGTATEEVIETYDQPPKMVVEEEMVETTLPSGEKVQRKMTVTRMVHTIRTRHKSMDEGGAEGSEEEYEIEEVVPGTETCFLDVSDASDVEDEGLLEATTPSGPSLLPPVLQRRHPAANEGGDGADFQETHQKNNSCTPTSSDEATRRPRPPLTATPSITITEDDSPPADEDDFVSYYGLDRSAAQPGDGAPSQPPAATGGGELDDTHTTRVMMKKEVHKKTVLGRDGQEETFVREESQVQQVNEPPEELRESMQEIINQFMETNPAIPEFEEEKGALEDDV